MADPDQIEQMLINLVRNAAEAALESPPSEKNQNGGEQSAARASKPQVNISWNSLETM